MRACQRNKNKSKESFREPLKQWHPSTRERLIQTSASNAIFDTKWGGFMSENWFNIDQTSCPFAFNTKQTYHLFEEGTNQHKEKSGFHSLVVVWTSGNARCRFMFAQRDHIQSLLSSLGLQANIFLMTKSKRGTPMWTCTSTKKTG